MMYWYCGIVPENRLGTHEENKIAEFARKRLFNVILGYQNRCTCIYLNSVRNQLTLLKILRTKLSAFDKRG